MRQSLLACALALPLAFPASASAERCQPYPDRLIVFGDSIVDCAGVGGPDGEDCSPRLLHEEIKGRWSPFLTYENLSVSGAVTAQVPNRQFPTMEVGPGHALVLIFVGGNDISPFLFTPDGAAEAAFPRALADLEESWGEIFSFLENPANFPDGVTVVINTQYNPFDDCYGTSDTKIALLGEYNAMITDLTADRPDAYTANPYAEFLGHGHNNNRRSCPYYERGADYWMGDLIHPNATGHGALADLWAEMADSMYGSCQ